MSGTQGGESPDRLFKPRLSEQLADIAKAALKKRGLSHQAKKIDQLLSKRQGTMPLASPEADEKGGTWV